MDNELPEMIQMWCCMLGNIPVDVSEAEQPHSTHVIVFSVGEIEDKFQ